MPLMFMWEHRPTLFMCNKKNAFPTSKVAKLFLKKKTDVKKNMISMKKSFCNHVQDTDQENIILIIGG